MRQFFGTMFIAVGTMMIALCFTGKAEAMQVPQTCTGRIPPPSCGLSSSACPYNTNGTQQNCHLSETQGNCYCA